MTTRRNFLRTLGSAPFVLYANQGWATNSATVAHPVATDAISVKAFNAVGDGVTDDTAAIQATLNAASAIAKRAGHYGITVYVPRGTYKTTSTITIPIYVNLVGETAEGVLILARFNGDAFQDATTPAKASYLYFTRIEEITILKANTNGTGNTAGNCITYRHKAQYCRFNRLRLYGGDYAIHGENVGGSYWNTFTEVTCYYQGAANVFIGQGSNVCRFNSCAFNNAPIGVHLSGTSYAVNFHSCAFEGYTTAAIQNTSAQVFASGGYFEQTGPYTMFHTTGAGTIDVIGAFIGFDAGGYLSNVEHESGKHRLRNCTLSNIPLTWYKGSYGQSNTEFADNNVTGNTPSILQGRRG